MLPVCVWVSSDNSTPAFTIPQELAEPRSRPSYLILQQLSVCRYRIALQKSPKCLGEWACYLGHVALGGMESFKCRTWSTVHVSAYCLQKNYLIMIWYCVWMHHTRWCQSLCHTTLLWMIYTPKPGCRALNNSAFKRRTLSDISHDNNEIAKSCITTQHFFTPSNLNNTTLSTSEKSVLVHVLDILRRSSQLLQAAVILKSFSSSWRKKKMPIQFYFCKHVMFMLWKNKYSFWRQQFYGIWFKGLI